MNTLVPPLAFGGLQNFGIVLAIFVPIILFMAAIVDLLAGSNRDSSSRVIWGLIILLIPVLGPIAYFATRQRRP